MVVEKPSNRKGISPTLLSERNGLKVIEMNEVRILGQMDNSIDHTFESANRVYDKLGLCPTIPTCAGGNIQPKIIDEPIRIRKLTPKECWRLMNFSDSDFEKASKVNSNTQLYKQAGNSIVVSCLTAIFSQLNIQGIKPWNERNDDEKKQLING